MMLEDSQSPFVMRGARGAISQGLHHIEEQVNTIERAVTENPGLAFDLAKALVESTCRTILAERGISSAQRDELPRLFQKVRDNLPMLPTQESHESGVRESIGRTLGGLNTAVQGIAELRNQLGFASHGTDRPRPSMETIHAVLARASRGHPCWVPLPYSCRGQDSSYCDRILPCKESRVRRIYR